MPSLSLLALLCGLVAVNADWLPTKTASVSKTVTSAATVTPSPTSTASETRSPTETASPSSTETSSVSATASATSSVSASSTPSETPSPSVTPSGTPIDAAAIYLLAGTYVPGNSGDDAAADEAELDTPLGNAVDAEQNVYIADSLNHCVRVVNDVTRIISAFVGVCGSSGNTLTSANATSFELNTPVAVAVGPDGAIFVSDSLNKRIVVVFEGVASTLTDVPSAKSLAGLTFGMGHLFVADPIGDVVWKIELASPPIVTVFAGTGTSGFSGDLGLATQAQLSFPSDVAYDGVNWGVLIADTNNNRIRFVDVSNIISTVAGNMLRGFAGDGDNATLAQLDHPTFVAVDAWSNIYFSDNGNERLRFVDGVNGTISTIAGNGNAGHANVPGPAILAELDSPQGVSVDYRGNVYLTVANAVQWIASTTSQSSTPSVTPSVTPSSTSSSSSSSSATSTETPSPTSSPSSTSSSSSTASSSETATASASATATETPSITETPAVTATATVSRTASATRTPASTRLEVARCVRGGAGC